MVASCIHILWTFENFLKIRVKVKMKVLQVRVSSSNVVHKIASQIVSFVYRRQILECLMQRYSWQQKVRTQKRSYKFNLWRIVPNYLLNGKYSIWAHISYALIPKLKNYIFLFLDLEKPFGMFRRPQKMVKHFVAEVKRRKDCDSANPETSIEFVEQLFTSFDCLIKIGQHDSLLLVDFCREPLNRGCVFSDEILCGNERVVFPQTVNVFDVKLSCVSAHFLPLCLLSLQQKLAVRHQCGNVERCQQIQCLLLQKDC